MHEPTYAVDRDEVAMSYPRTLTLLLLAASCCGVLAAQTLEVSKSPVSVDTEYLESGAAFDHALVALRFEATGGDEDVNGFALEPDGATFETDVTDLAFWLDDGDGLFDDQTDTLLWTGQPVLPKTTATFTPPLTITSGTFEDIWIVASFGPNAGSSLGKTYSVALGDTADVDAGGANVVIGSLPPESAPVKLVYFEAVPYSFQGRLEFHGSGFTPPFTLTVNGVSYDYPAPTGTPWVNWTPWGMAYMGPGYMLLEDHSAVEIFAAYDGWEETRWEDIFEDDSEVSVQLMTASSGPHDLGTLTFYRTEPGCSGDCCTTADGDTGLPIGLTILLLGLSLKAIIVATHLRGRPWHDRGIRPARC